MKGLKIHVILLAFVVTLGVALGGSYFVYRQRVTDPLLTNMADIPGVANARLEQVGNKKDVVIRLAGDADLIDAFVQAENLAGTILGDNLGRVKAEDDRNARLSQVFYRMHFHVQQGIATGLFAGMAEEIDQIAAEANLVDHKVMVTPDRVFVALRGDGHNLLEVITRTPLVAEAPPVARRAVTLW